MTYLFVSTEFTNVTDTHTRRHTDTQTPHGDIGRACIASRGKYNKTANIAIVRSALYSASSLCL